MKTTHRHLYALLLALLCAASALAHDFSVDGIHYNILSADEQTCEVTKYGNGSNNYYDDVVVPSTVIYDCKLYSVVAIGDYAFSNCTSLTSVEIPASVTRIGNHAFDGCKYSLESVVIPNSVTEIGDLAFFNCNKLTSITIPESATTIGESLLAGCTKLTDLNVAGDLLTVENKCLVAADGTLVAALNEAEIEIPATVTRIGAYAFYGLYRLKSVKIPDGVTEIGHDAFYGCSSLAEIEIPNSVTSIGASAFYGCSKLAEIEIPNSVTSIGNGAFYGCSGLTGIEIPSSVTSIGGMAFYG